MSYLRTKGIIIKEVHVGEADKIVTIFSGDNGKLSARAKNARRPRSKLAAGTQYLCLSDFVLFKGSDMYSINSCDIAEPFYEIRNDLEKLTYAAHMTDIVGDVIQENLPSKRLLQLFLNSLYMLSKTEKNPELVVRVFELRLLTIIGYGPRVKGCVACGSEDYSDCFFSFEKCGIVCKSCVGGINGVMSISPGTARALKHIVHSGMKELFGFDVSSDVLNELGRLSGRYLREQLDKEYTKLDFLKSLKQG